MSIDYSQVPKDCRDDAYKYCRMVLDEDIVACDKVKKACLRHINDLICKKNKDFEYDYFPDKAQKVINFIEILPDVKTGKSFPLAYFQKFIVCSLYGWKRKSDPTVRRFKKAFISVARKNGKTILVAGIILYEFLFSSNPQLGRQIFCTANDKEQAKIAFEMARKQLDALRAQDSDVRKATKKVREKLENLNDESYIRPLSKETGAIDGFEPYIGLLDEYGASKTDEMMELLESGQVQLDNALILIISTAGFDLNYPMKRIEYPLAEKILNKKVIDEEYYAYIAEQESVEELNNPETYIKSNPILEIADKYDTVMRYLIKRISNGKETGAMNKILVKNFNVWTKLNEESYMSGKEWEGAKHEDKPDIHGKRIWIGIDVGRSSDLYSISWLTMNDSWWDVDSFSFVATKYGLQTKIKRDGMNYIDLERMGECEITTLESGVIDDERTFEWLEEFVYSNELEVVGIFYDPYQFGTLLTMIEKRHPEWQLVEIPQTTMVLNMPTKQFRDDVIAGKIRHYGNQLLTAAINNAYLRSDNNGVRIDKNKNSNKIDPLDALLDPYAACYLESFDGEGYWTNEKILNEEGGMF